MAQSTSHVKPGEGYKDLTQDPRRLRYRRYAAGLSIRELSALAGVATGSISCLENGKYPAGVLTLRALAEALGCEIADLMPEERKAA